MRSFLVRTTLVLMVTCTWTMTKPLPSMEETGWICYGCSFMNWGTVLGWITPITRILSCSRIIWDISLALSWTEMILMVSRNYTVRFTDEHIFHFSRYNLVFRILKAQNLSVACSPDKNAIKQEKKTNKQ